MRKTFIFSLLTIFLASCAMQTSDEISTSNNDSQILTAESLNSDSIDSSNSDLSIGETNSIADTSSPQTTTTAGDSGPGVSTPNSSSNGTSQGGTSTDTSGKINITVKSNDGTSNKVYQAASGSVTYKSLGLTNPTRSGYVFMGWFVDNNGTLGKQITPDHTLTTASSHTISAKWIANQGFQAPTYDETYNFENEKGFDFGGTVHSYYEETTDIRLLLDGAFIGNGNRNRHKDHYSLRVGKKDFLETETKIKGLDRLSFYHAPYAPTDGGTVYSDITVSYSIDGSVWTEFKVVKTTNKNNENGMLSYDSQELDYPNGIGIGYEVYIRIQNGVKYADNTVNIDNLRLQGTRFVGAY